MNKINTLDAAARKKLMERVRKLLAMAASNSPAEAEIAMIRAQRLMAEYGIAQADIDASAIETERTRSANKAHKPTRWDACLAASVADAFGCRVQRSTEWRGRTVLKSEWQFVGIGATAKVAAYAYAAMRTQLVKARKEYIELHMSSFGRSYITRMGDKFAEGWVVAATRTIREFAAPKETAKTLDAWIKSQSGSVGEVEAIKRKSKHSAADSLAAMRGLEAGKGAKLHHGVDGQAGQQLLIGGAA